VGPVRGLLLDVDGTLLHGDRAVPGAAEAIARLRESGRPFLLTTNTTRRSRRHVAAELWAAGILVREDEVVAPSVLARRLVLDSGAVRALLLVAPNSLPDFAGIEAVERGADWVVVGDLGEGFTFERANAAFLALRGGARLLALHRNPWWHAGPAGPTLDAGAYVAALEYAAGVRAVSVGKPEPAFYELALRLLGVPAGEVLVVGDDAVNDVRGGRAAGCLTAIVRTGKYSEDALASAGVTPDLVLDSIADLRV
jgi:HAD superfamily hydrolase (TIGR01458 family)